MTAKRFRKLHMALMARVMENDRRPGSHHKGAGLRWASSFRPGVPYKDAWSAVSGLAASCGVGRR